MSGILLIAVPVYMAILVHGFYARWQHHQHVRPSITRDWVFGGGGVCTPGICPRETPSHLVCVYLSTLEELPTPGTVRCVCEPRGGGGGAGVAYAPYITGDAVRLDNQLLMNCFWIFSLQVCLPSYTLLFSTSFQDDTQLTSAIPVATK